LKSTIGAIKSTPVILSLGLVFRRNIWETDISAAVEALGGDRVIFATSSSLLHIPLTLASERKLTKEQKYWFSFALEPKFPTTTIGSFPVHGQVLLAQNRLSILYGNSKFTAILGKR
jgi:5-methyltetrahydropteroyltriglutamate--homocysteine methyltransferase